ncbi:hypothetical protein I316_05004 [Kwoniella heveanensis BCC8398]|uniref:Membrane insertase YidC/Oxa/ALB C-terminal domain-containing protein n=1 Tax=Kwoniella heveanensis BCC8398 TaxID=1296120 RepID=A0A1B9GQH8_9TREE|nr:hypothetical protein I316_05004 [Kwoniella heveanensis BCC8398]
MSRINALTSSPSSPLFSLVRGPILRSTLSCGPSQSLAGSYSGLIKIKKSPASTRSPIAVRKYHASTSSSIPGHCTPPSALSTRIRPHLSSSARRPGRSASSRWLSSTPIISSSLDSSTPIQASSSPLPSFSDDLPLTTASTTDDALTPLSTIFDPLIDPLSSFLLSMPHPFGYGATIIALTLLVRTVFTLPISLWQRERALKARRLVDPKMKVINEQLAKSLAGESRKKGLTYDQYLLELRRQLAKAQSTLHRIHGTNPTITTWSPLLVHIPIFVTLSLTIRKTLEIPSSPVFNESFLWLEKLGEVDPYGILPLVGMSMAFGNAELVGRRNKAAADSAAEAVRVKEGEGKESFVTPSNSGSEQSQRAPPGSSPAAPREPSIFAPRTATSTPSRISTPAPSTSATTTTRTRSRSLSTSSTTFVSSSSVLTASTSSTSPFSSSSQSRSQSRSARQVVASSRAKQETLPSSAKQLVDADLNGRRSRQAFTPARQQELRRNFMAGVLRFSALGFGMIASQMPANVLLSWLPQRRQAAEAAKAALTATAPTSSQ